jgi:peptide/nickel transport system permease protein
VAAWLVRRIGAAVAIVFAVVTLTFFLIQLAPGTPFLQGSERSMDPEVLRRLNVELGLDRPLLVRYLKWLAAVAHGELGESFSQRRPVAAALADAIPNTLVLGAAALCIDFVLGLLLGVLQAVRRGRATDIVLGNVALFLYSVPTFWLGLIALLIFGQWLHWFPVGGITDPVVYPSLSWIGKIGDRLWHLALPALTLGLVGAAGTARYQRAAMLEALHQDFVRTARAKGVGERRVIMRHVLRNALLPVITLFGLALPFLLTGAVLVESVFSWPGMGRLAATAIFQRDYPLVTGATMLAATLVVAGTLVADVLYHWADPRVRVDAT